MTTTVPDFNPQDAFATLVEDARIGQVGRPLAVHSPRLGVRFVPHRPVIALDDLPVFFLSGEHHQLHHKQLLEPLERIMAGTFHLPYQRCALMMSMSGDHPGLAHVAERMRVRHSYVMVWEENDTGLHVTPFQKNARMDHWSRQLFEVDIEFGEQGQQMVSYDPAWGTFPEEFITSVEESFLRRVHLNLIALHKMTVGRGKAEHVTGSPKIAGQIEARRTRMGLPAIPQVIALDLDALAPAPAPPGPGAGAVRRPHYRRGTWVAPHIRHGRPIEGFWRKASAIHGGGQTAPPWYEVAGENKTSP